MSTNDGISSDDLIKKSNEEWHKSQEPSKDYSLASKSSITTPEQDERKRSMAEGIISDLANQRADIDSLQQVIKVVSEQQNQLAVVVNQLTQAINNLAPGNAQNPQSTEKGLNMDNLAALSDVAEKLMGAWKSYKGDNAPVALIDQETINREMQSAFFDNLNTGKSINNFVKDALKKKATKEILKSTMETLGQDEHAPQ
ncbi:MAG: hypothetical protein V3U54_13430 [Thermodesulfobacteriota bacterium]